jgi:hypothetical protein
LPHSDLYPAPGHNADTYGAERSNPPDQLTTGRAQFGCVPGIDQHHRPPSLFRFGGRVLYQLPPGSIRNAFAHPTTAAYLLQLQILKGNDLEAIYQLPADLVGKVVTPEGYPLVDTSKCFRTSPMLIPLLGVFGRILSHTSNFRDDQVVAANLNPNSILRVVMLR